MASERWAPDRPDFASARILTRLFMAAGPARADDGGGDDRRRSWWHGDHGSLRELLVHVGAFAALASVAWIVGHLAEQRKRRKTLILALTSPNCRNREGRISWLRLVSTP